MRCAAHSSRTRRRLQSFERRLDAFDLGPPACAQSARALVAVDGQLRAARRGAHASRRRAARRRWPDVSKPSARWRCSRAATPSAGTKTARGRSASAADVGNRRHGARDLEPRRRLTAKVSGHRMSSCHRQHHQGLRSRHRRARIDRQEARRRRPRRSSSRWRCTNAASALAVLPRAARRRRAPHRDAQRARRASGRRRASLGDDRTR